MKAYIFKAYNFFIFSFDLGEALAAAVLMIDFLLVNVFDLKDLAVFCLVKFLNSSGLLSGQKLVSLIIFLEDLLDAKNS